MPANDEGKLIAYKWRKSAILETPEQKNCQHEARAVNCPTLFNVKIRAI